jgi:hypothetical protein
VDHCDYDEGADTQDDHEETAHPAPDLKSIETDKGNHPGHQGEEERRQPNEGTKQSDRKKEQKEEYGHPEVDQ